MFDLSWLAEWHGGCLVWGWWGGGGFGGNGGWEWGLVLRQRVPSLWRFGRSYGISSLTALSRHMMILNLRRIQLLVVK